MNGHVRKRGRKWEVVLELGEQDAQQCPACVNRRGRSRRYWADKGRLAECPTCGGQLEDVTVRRQIVLPERYRLKSEADAALTREKNADLNGAFVQPDKLTLGEYLTEHWLPNLAGNVRETTLIAYRGHVERYIVPALGGVRLRKLSTTAVNAFYRELRDAPRKPRRPRRAEVAEEAQEALGAAEEPKGAPLSERTRRHVHVTLRTALNAAVREGLLVTNPASRATAPKRTNGPEMRTWTGAQVRAFLEATSDDREHALWRLLVMSGMRRGEALGLKWSDVDLRQGRVNVQRSRVLAGGKVLEHPPKTERGRRSVPIDPATVTALRAWKARQNTERLEWGAAWSDGGWVFTAEDGAPLHPGVVTNRFRQAADVLELPRIRLYDLRHTSATLALVAGEHPKVVQERLGHATIAQTMDTYSHTMPALHEAAAERLAALVDGEG